MGDLNSGKPTGVCLKLNGEKSVALSDIKNVFVFGAVASGKTTFLRDITDSLIKEYDENAVKLLAIDLKGGEFDEFSADSHFLSPVIKDYNGAVDMLSEVLETVCERLKKMREKDVLKFDDYNAVCADDKLPRIVVIIDEATTLCSDGQQAIKLLTEIAQRGWAVGVHLIVATQALFYSQDFCALRAVLQTKVCFKVIYKEDSVSFIGQEGGEKLHCGEFLLSIPTTLTVEKYKLEI